MIERKHATATERERILHVALMMDMADGMWQDLGERARLVPGLRRWMGLSRWVMERILTDLMRTIPVEQAVTLQRCVKNATYITGVRGAGKTKHHDEWGTYISYQDLGVLTEVVLAQQCALCDMCTDPVRAAKCPIRRAMDNVGSDAPESKGGRCKYWEAAIDG